MKKTHFIVSEKKWHKELYHEIKKEITDTDWILIEDKETFNINFLKKFNVGKILFPIGLKLFREIFITNMNV